MYQPAAGLQVLSVPGVVVLQKAQAALSTLEEPERGKAELGSDVAGLGLP